MGVVVIASPQKNSYCIFANLTTPDFPAYLLNPIGEFLVGEYGGNYNNVEAFLKEGESGTAWPPTANLIK